MTRLRQFAIAPPVLLAALLAGGASRIVQDECGPFTDVSPAFCPYVSELYYLGITAGTSATTFSPDDPLTRGQAAVFVAKGLNQSLARSSRRAALGQWWTTTPHYSDGFGLTSLDASVGQPCADGSDIWVPSLSGAVSRIRASDGRLLETWTVSGGNAALCAMGRVFVATFDSKLFMIDPSQPPGAATLLTSNLGKGPQSLAFDGNRIWTANPVGECACDPYPPGSISIVTPGSWSVQTVTYGTQYPFGIVFDGINIWVTDVAGGALLRLDSSGAIAQTITTGSAPRFPVFDGANIWVPNYGSSSVTLVRASTGQVITTLTGNGIGTAVAVAFDGERVLISSDDGGVSVWNAQDLSPIGSFSTQPLGGVAAVSDGINFWLTLSDFSSSGALARY